mmetsp:Transcript_45323/g.144454  ORF Transcript_45323/g.144454 Transcript_45323/m.144454 type:complete len:130 (-) Transcript_45323:170-559(-)
MGGKRRQACLSGDRRFGELCTLARSSSWKAARTSISPGPDCTAALVKARGCDFVGVTQARDSAPEDRAPTGTGRELLEGVHLAAAWLDDASGTSTCCDPHPLRGVVLHGKGSKVTGSKASGSPSPQSSI